MKKSSNVGRGSEIKERICHWDHFVWCTLRKGGPLLCNRKSPPICMTMIRGKLATTKWLYPIRTTQIIQKTSQTNMNGHCCTKYMQMVIMHWFLVWLIHLGSDKNQYMIHTFIVILISQEPHLNKCCQSLILHLWKMTLWPSTWSALLWLWMIKGTPISNHFNQSLLVLNALPICS